MDCVHTDTVNNLVLPNRVALQPVDKNLLPVRLAGVLFEITLFARQTNDFNLSPFGTDADGLVTIPRRDIDAEVKSNYDSDLMGHGHVTTVPPGSRFDCCHPMTSPVPWARERRYGLAFS